MRQKHAAKQCMMLGFHGALPWSCLLQRDKRLGCSASRQEPTADLGAHIWPAPLLLRRQRDVGIDIRLTIRDVLQGAAHPTAVGEKVAETGGRYVRPRTDGQARYVKAMRDHDLTVCVGPAGTGKTYLALVTGTYPANKKVIDLPLHKYLQADGERRVKVVAKDDPDGMRAITLVKVARKFNDFTLLEVTIKTGRTQ